MSDDASSPLQRGLSAALAAVVAVALVVTAVAATASNAFAATSTFTVSTASGSASASPGTSTTVRVTLTGSGAAATLSLSGLPSTVRASFNPTKVTPTASGATSTLTLAVASTAEAGTYSLTLNAKAATLERAPLDLVVSGVDASTSPSVVTVARASTSTATVKVAAINATPPAATLAVSGLPSGVTASFSPTSVTPSADGTPATLTFNASASASTGTRNVTVTATSPGFVKSTSVVALTVAAAAATSPAEQPVSTSTNTATITAPRYDGATVGGTYTLSGAVSDANGFGVQLARDEWDLDGAPISVQSSTPGTPVRWDTTTAAPGAHTLTYKAWDTSGASAVASRPVTVGPATVKRVAVILYNFSDQAPPTTPATVADWTFGSARSIAGYYQEETYGRLVLGGVQNPAGDVFGFFPIPYAIADYKFPNCDFAHWESAAQQSARSAGVNLDAYDVVLMTAAVPTGCGSGYGGGAIARVPWNNPSSPDQWIAFAGHEIGHSFGLPQHAHSWSCVDGSGRKVQVSSSCTSSEYGDPYDLMGSGHVQHMSMYEKGQLGVLTAAQTATVMASGTYTLAPSTSSAAGVQSIRIPRAWDGSGKATDFYYFELRQRTPYDAPDSVIVDFDGVQIRQAPDFQATQTAGSNLIDATPGSILKVGANDAWDSRLPAGRYFQDVALGLSVQVVSTSSSGASIQVAFGPPPCVRATPTVSIDSPSWPTAAGATLGYTITIRNNDSPACGASAFGVASSVPAGWSVSPASGTVPSVYPASASTWSFSVSVPAGTPAGAYSFATTATDGASGASGAVSATVTVG